MSKTTLGESDHENKVKKHWDTLKCTSLSPPNHTPVPEGRVYTSANFSSSPHAHVSHITINHISKSSGLRPPSETQPRGPMRANSEGRTRADTSLPAAGKQPCPSLALRFEKLPPQNPQKGRQSKGRPSSKKHLHSWPKSSISALLNGTSRCTLRMFSSSVIWKKGGGAPAMR